MRRLPLAAALACILLAPAASAASASLFFHVADAANLESIPLNVLPPPDGFRFDAGGGPAAATFTCLGGAGAPRVESHTVYGVAYAAATDDGVLPQVLRGEMRGLAYPLQAPRNLTLHWHIEASASSGGPEVPLANVVVRATVRAGEDAAGGTAGYDGGLLVASGESPPALLAGPQSQGAEAEVVDGRTVYHFAVPMDVVAASVSAEGFNVRVDVRVDNPACAALEGMVMPPLVRIHSSPGHRPRLDLSYDVPLVVEEAALDGRSAATGAIRLRVAAHSVWGAYAVGNLSVGVEGPSAPAGATTTVVMPDLRTAGASPRSPAFFFWRWPAAEERAAAGDYRLDVTVSDVAGNLAPPVAVPFSIAPGEDHPAPPGQASPSPLAAAVVAILGLAAARQRKRA